MKDIDLKTDGYYIALGSFDGLHKGHLELINKANYLAKHSHSKSMVFTFSNHPREVIDKGYKFKYLMNNKEKEIELSKLGVDKLVLESFNKEFMKLSPEEFIKSLVNRFKVKGLVVGFNYKFGFKNSGDINLLDKLSKKYGFSLDVIKPCMYRDEVVSSTRIRNALLEGKIKEGNEMLTRPYSLEGMVVKGKQLGRTIGFPTANLKFDENFIIPKRGVYYTNVSYNNKTYKGITNIGYNPTVNGENLTIETYILDFNRDIYGDRIKILFLDRIREEKKFNSLEELTKQLNRDKEIAKSMERYVIE